MQDLAQGAQPWNGADERAERLRQRGNDAHARGSYTRAAELYKRVRL